MIQCDCFLINLYEVRFWFRLLLHFEMGEQHYVNGILIEFMIASFYCHSLKTKSMHIVTFFHIYAIFERFCGFIGILISHFYGKYFMHLLWEKERHRKSTNERRFYNKQCHFICQFDSFNQHNGEKFTGENSEKTEENKSSKILLNLKFSLPSKQFNETLVVLKPQKISLWQCN